MKNSTSHPTGDFNEKKKRNFQIFLSQNNLLSSDFQESETEQKIELLDPLNKSLQEHFMKIWDVKGLKIYGYSLSRSAFREYMLKRYCNNVTARIIFLLRLPKRTKFNAYVESCNNLIKMSHYEKLKLSFGFFDHDFDDKISVTDGLLMMK